jgi:peptidoglycan/LPS O-acetylase OafA/YrhL
MILLRIIGAVLILLAVVGFMVTFEEYGSGSPRNPILNPLMSVLFVVIGVCLFHAARMRYSLSWSMIGGVGLIFLGLAIVAIFLDDMLAGEKHDLTVGFLVGAVFLVAGFVLIQSGRPRKENGDWPPEGPES